MNEEKPTENFGATTNQPTTPLPAFPHENSAAATPASETSNDATDTSAASSVSPETSAAGAPTPQANDMPAHSQQDEAPATPQNPFGGAFPPVATGFVRNPDGTYTPTYIPYSAYPQVQQPKRRWTTSALAAAAAAGLILGGLLGGTAGVAFGGSSDVASSQQQHDSQQWGGGSLPGQEDGRSSQGTSPWGNFSAEGLTQGTKLASAPGVVLINSKLYNGQGAGTGIIVDKSGVVITNYHVVEGSTQVKVTTADGSKTYTATVIGHNQKKDVAVLQIADAPNDLETVSIAKSSAKIGDTVYAQGNGSGQGYITELEGKVTDLNESITASDRSNQKHSNKLTGLIKTDADVVAGYSGGPLMNTDREVVGINTAASTGQTSEEVDGYAIPISDVMSIANAIRNGDTSNGNVIGRNAALGITVTTVTLRSNSGPAAAVQVQEVSEGSGAAKAGLQAGDVITALNGKSVTSASDLSDSIKAKAIGDKVTVTVIRNNQQQDITVTLGEAIVN